MHKPAYAFPVLTVWDETGSLNKRNTIIHHIVSGDLLEPEAVPARDEMKGEILLHRDTGN